MSPDTGLKCAHSQSDCVPSYNGSRVSDPMELQMKLYSASICSPLKRSSFAALSLFSAVTLSAQASDNLDPMTVTADRFQTANALVPTTVISRADIERLQINDLPTLLSRVPGVEVSTQGGMGAVSSIFMRGTNSDHVLVLVDGVKWRSATTGTASIQDFPVSQIERIEIVRGPRSGLYGSEAIGGVIQIFTRKGEKGLHPYFTAGYGTHNTQQLSAGLSGGDDSTHFNVSASHDSTDGISWLKNSQPDKDNFRNNSVQAELDHQFNDQFSVGLNLIHIDGFNRYDNQFAMNDKADYFSNTEQDVWGVHGTYKATKQWTFKAQLSESRDNLANYLNGANNGDFLTKHYHGNLTSSFELNAQNTFNVGFDYDEDRLVSSTDYDKTSRDNRALFASWVANVDKHSWLLSIRHDNNEQFGNHTTGNAEYGYWLQPDLRMTLNAGTGFKAPTFNVLYYPNSGNSDLQPEKSVSYGAGLKGYKDWGNWSVNIYQNKIRNLVDYIPPTYEAVSADARIRGVEFEINTVLVGWNLDFNASLLQPNDLTTGKLLARRAKRLMNVNIHRDYGAWTIGGDWHLSDYSYSDPSNTQRLGGYGTLALRAAYHVDKSWSLRVSGLNVLDKQYETVYNYNTLGRTLMFSMHYQ